MYIAFGIAVKLHGEDACMQVNCGGTKVFCYMVVFVHANAWDQAMQWQVALAPAASLPRRIAHPLLAASATT